jgi:hypothetical protein
MLPHLKNTTFLSNITVLFLSGNCHSQLQLSDLGIIHAYECHYRRQLFQKTVAMVDGRLLQDDTQMKLDVLSAMHFTAHTWRLITSATIKNCFLKCGFSNDHVSSNDNSALKLNKGKKVTGTVYNLVVCSLRTTQDVTVLFRSVETKVSTRG